MRYAYLITAHKENKVLEILLKLLDSQNNDIYIHIDAKTKEFDFDKISKNVEHSKIFFTDRIKVYWGDYSQVNAELILLKAATKREKYDYYHFISGQDLPIKSNSWIDAFFEANSGKEFVSCCKEPVCKEDIGGVFNYYSRLSLYHYGIKLWRKNKIFKVMEYASLWIQRKIGVNRISEFKEPIYYGANWFSITDSCARYVVSKEQYIFEHFSGHTRCADELFMQTVLMSSPFKNSITGDNLRYVDFKRGKPYVWRTEDKDELLSAPAIFARKFDEQIDSVIVDEICNAVRDN